MAISKTGVSIAEMQRELEIKDYKTRPQASVIFQVKKLKGVEMPESNG